METKDRLEALEKNLNRAQRQNGRLLTLLAVIAVGGGVSLWLARGGQAAHAAEAAATPKRITAREFVLVDENGAKRAALTTRREEGSKYISAFLEMYSEDGKKLAMYIINEDGSSVLLRDQKGSDQLILWAGEGAGGIEIFGEHRKQVWSAP